MVGIPLIGIYVLSLIYFELCLEYH